MRVKFIEDVKHLTSTTSGEHVVVYKWDLIFTKSVDLIRI